MSNLTTQASTEMELTVGLVFANRLRQLGISRRELMRRSGLSRQTLHNIEHEDRTTLKPHTMTALDKALHWHPGTMAALCQGDFTVVATADEWVAEEREGAYRWRVVQRVSRMTLEDLERLISMMDGAELGSMAEEDPDERLIAMEHRLASMERRLADAG